MTEAEWLNATDPTLMLTFLRERGKLSERKYSLFACGSVRGAWHLLDDRRCRRAIEVAEAAADGLTAPGELRAAVLAADKVGYQAKQVEDQARAARHAWAVAQRAVERQADKGRAATDGRAEQVARQAAQTAEQLAQRAEATRWAREAVRAACLCVRAAWYRSQGQSGAEISLEQAVEAAGGGQDRAFQCQLLRDVFGPLPFRPVAVEPSLLRWNDGTVVKVARGIYDDRAFGRMPLLADGLLDAGCDNEEILQHCHKQEAVHVRGCWVIDLLLGKE